MVHPASHGGRSEERTRRGRSRFASRLREAGEGRGGALRRPRRPPSGLVAIEPSCVLGGAPKSRSWRTAQGVVGAPLRSSGLAGAFLPIAMDVLAWLRVRKGHHFPFHERAFESHELGCQSLLVSRASRRALPLAADTKVLRDEGVGRIHRLCSAIRLRECDGAPLG